MHEKQLPRDGGKVGMDAKNSERDEIISKLQDEYNAAIYLYSGEINETGFGRLVSCIQDTDRPNVLLILVTHGGDANAAYQIAKLMMSTSTEFYLCIPSVCKSAGTLVAIGASELIMGPFSELGPLDVQLLVPDELGSRKSGLLSRSTFERLADETFYVFERTMLQIKNKSFDNISFKTAAALAAQIAVGVMEPVYAQINTDVVGNDYRDLKVATEYGRRLARRSRNSTPQTVDRLVSAYPSHDFIIDEDEAGELFRRVASFSEALFSMIACIGDDAFRENGRQRIEALTISKGSKDDDDTKSDAPAATDASESRTVDSDSPGSRESDPRAGDTASPGSEAVAAVAPEPKTDKSA